MGVNDKTTCTSCGKTKRKQEFYRSYSDIYKFIGTLSVCKDCTASLVDETDMRTVKDMLRKIDRPLLMNLYDSSITEASKDNRSAFRTYMKNLGMAQYKELTWDDSDSGNQVANLIIDKEEEQVDEEISKYWGNGYGEQEYAFLEEERYKLMSSFECPDYGMEMIMKDICFINLDIEKTRQERKENSGKTITNLIKTRSDLMNDANMKPIQSTGAEANDQITFGTLIKKWENEKPVPKKLDDEMKEYIDTFMIGHLAKMEGLNNEMTTKYDEALTNFTIDFEEINKDQDEFED